ncbi:MAG: ATP synthase F1 subunit gamma, partial [Flavobacteriales bacterium]
MANLKEIRTRIASVNSTMQITSAMKMVSAAKLRKAQDAIVQLRPYAGKLSEILSDISGSLDTSEGWFSEEREVKNVLIVPIVSNRGLCGAFNSSVIKKVEQLIKAEFADKNVTILPAGKKADDHFKSTSYYIKGVNLPRHMNEIWDDLTFDNVANKAEKLITVFANGEFDKVLLVYNRFKNAAVHLLTVEQFLPVLPAEPVEKLKSAGKSANDYIYEPARTEILSDLVPRSLRTQFYKAFLDSRAAEHGA